jgi:hypothetical protein
MSQGFHIEFKTNIFSYSVVYILRVQSIQKYNNKLQRVVEYPLKLQETWKSGLQILCAIF